MHHRRRKSYIVHCMRCILRSLADSYHSWRAWAEARNVNLVNVHSWWYRRRPLAKKLKIKIPGEQYELAVGNPPLILEIEEIKAEVSNEVPTSNFSPMRSSLPGISDAENLISCINAVDLFENSSSDEFSADCMRSSSPLQEVPWLAPSTSMHLTVSRNSSPSLPPSSPSTPPPCLLTLPEDTIVKDDTAGPLLGIFFRIQLWRLVFILPDSTQAELEKIGSSTLYSPHSFSRLLET